MKFTDYLYNSINLTESTEENKTTDFEIFKKAAFKIGMAIKEEKYIKDEPYTFINFGNRSIERRLNREYLQHIDNPSKEQIKEKRYIVSANLEYIPLRDLFIIEINDGSDDPLYQCLPMKLEKIIELFKGKTLNKIYDEYIDWRLVNKFVKSYEEVISGNIKPIYPLAIRKLAEKYNLELIDYGIGKVKIIFDEKGKNIEFLKTLIIKEGFKLSKDKSYVSKGSLVAAAFTDQKRDEKFVSIKF